MIGLLSIILWVPLLASPIAYLLGKFSKKASRYFTIVISGIEALLALYVWFVFVPSLSTTLQLKEQYTWIPQLGMEYFLAVDGLSMPLVFLTGFLIFVAALSSNHITERVGSYYALLLFMETGIFGVFMALDLFLFYIFWEVVLVPMFFLIGIWGGPKRKYAAIKFFIYTHLASVIMLISIFMVVWLYYQNTGVMTFNLTVLNGSADGIGIESLIVSGTLRLILFLALLFGFLVKVPSVPFHTWLPDAHVQAPSPISIVLAGLLLKMGGYGLIRIAVGLLPITASSISFYTAWLGIVSIFYAGFVAMGQEDIKRLIAYSSISHMGIVVLGVSAGNELGFAGAMFMMFSHGLINGLMFLLSGVYKHHVHSMKIYDIRGLVKQMPLTSGFLVFGAFASAGLPGLSGFVAEFLAILGAFMTWELQIAIVVLGVVITAGYLLWMIQRVIFGEQREKAGVHDLELCELVALSLLAFLIVLLGVYPNILLDVIRGPAALFSKLMSGG
ncbi:MAG: complex I subunit 4 family protein [Candidatus Asgardarchaeia archaeon]